MNKNNIPQIDSISDLADFWDKNDLLDFEDELEQVHDSVFEQETAVTIHLLPKDVKAVEKLASLKGIPNEDLIYQWVQEKLQDI